MTSESADHEVRVSNTNRRVGDSKQASGLESEPPVVARAAEYENHRPTGELSTGEHLGHQFRSNSDPLAVRCYSERGDPRRFATVELAYAHKKVSDKAAFLDCDELEPVCYSAAPPRFGHDLDLFAPVTGGIGERHTNEIDDCRMVLLLSISNDPAHGEGLLHT